MWLLSVAQAVAITVAGVPTSGSAAPSPSGLPEPIPTRQSYFAIPFEIDHIEHPTLGAAEIQLFVSLDGGATWQHENSVNPTTKYFLFRAGGDGEYWFAVRTRDRSGNFRPPVVRDPGLRVIVDTQAPGLKIDAHRGQAGEIVARWQIDEPNIDPETLKIQYRVGESRQWETVAVDTSALRPGSPALSGEETWWTPAGPERIEIRAEVADAAGNRNVSHAQVVSVAAAPRQEPYVASTNQPSQQQDTWQASRQDAYPKYGETPYNGSSPEQVGGEAIGVNARQEGSQYGSNPYGSDPYDGSGSPVANPAPSRPSQGGSNAYPGNGQANGYALDRNGQDPWPRAPGADMAGQSGSAPRGPDSRQGQETSPQGWSGGTNTYQPMPNAVAAQPAPAYQNQYLPNSPAGIDHERAGAANESPAVPRPAGRAGKAVASRIFEIDYSLPNDPMSVGRVELFGTRDGGRSWQSYGYDSDSLSPMIARVPEEGTYGFKVVFHPMNGPSATPPSRGQTPDITIHVDLTRPSAQLLGVDRRTGESQMTIRWRASDERLDDMPISLSYADTTTGQWRTIARDLRNSGSYDWTLPAYLPQQIQVRLEARDTAGNVAIAETRNPIPVFSTPVASASRGTPSAQIQDVRPVGQPNYRENAYPAR